MHVVLNAIVADTPEAKDHACASGTQRHPVRNLSSVADIAANALAFESTRPAGTDICTDPAIYPVRVPFSLCYVCLPVHALLP